MRGAYIPIIIFVVLVVWISASFIGSQPKYSTDYVLYVHGAFQVSISEDGNYIAAIGNAQMNHGWESVDELYLFSSEDNNPLWTYRGVSSASISSDGSHVVAIGNDKLHLFSTTSSEPLWTYDGITSE